MGFAATGEPTNGGWFIGGDEKKEVMSMVVVGVVMVVSERVKGVVVMTWPTIDVAGGDGETVKLVGECGTGDLGLVDG
ncbi:hypothetical protein Tco_0783981 [Tanacetum coccineum]